MSILTWLYIVALIVGIVWVVNRAVRFSRQTKARNEAEQRLAETMSADDIKAYMEFRRASETEGPEDKKQ